LTAAPQVAQIGSDHPRGLCRDLVNEAALMATRHKRERVELADFTEALSRIILGSERRITLSPEERERTAYHESGHAILGMVARRRSRAQGVDRPPRTVARGHLPKP
jgi:cell division protease FtsH